MNPLSDTNLFKDITKLPNLDWNISIFGAHSQSITEKWKIPPDRHMAFEIIYVIRGEEYILIEDMPYTLNSGDFIIIPPNHLHEVHVDGHPETEYFCLHFDITDPYIQIQLIKKGSFYFNRDDPLASNLSSIIKKWIYLNQSNRHTSTVQMLVLSTLIEFLSHLLDIIADGNYDNSINLTQLKLANLISIQLKNAVEDTVHSDLNNKLSVCDIRISDISKNIGISSQYAFEVYKTIYGISPRKHLNNLIIGKVNSFLQKPDLSISEISQTLGYSTPGHFSRQFKRWTDLTPTEYRKIFFQENSNNLL